jgi:hypothetical protein
LRFRGKVSERSVASAALEVGRYVVLLFELRDSLVTVAFDGIDRHRPERF